MKLRIAAILAALCLGTSLCLTVSGCDVYVGEASSTTESGKGDEMLDNTEENADDDTVDEDTGDEDMDVEMDMAMDDIMME